MPKPRTGRPVVGIDAAQLKALMRLKPTLEDTAAFFECTTRTIERFIRKSYDLTFTEYREQKMVHTRFELVRTALNEAKKGNNIMLIFCLKNLCGWRDKQLGEEQPATVVNNNVIATKSDEDLDKRVKELMSAPK